MKIVKWGLVGCGDISARRVAPALRDLSNCDLVAVNRNDFTKAQSFAEQFGTRKWHKEWRKLINDDEIDAVYIATPVYLHAEQTIAAAQAGKHVLCEKPMAMNAQECDVMIDAAQKNGVKLGVAYYRHFYPVIHRIKDIMARGEIGKIVTVYMKAFSRFNPQRGEARHWLVVPEKSGGGPMMDFGCHRIEVLLDLLGPIAHVQSLINKVFFDRDVEDTATALFEFKNGAHGILSALHSAFEPKDSIEIYGTEGSLYINNLNHGDLRIVTQDGERAEQWPPHHNLHQPHIDDFTKAVLENRPPGVTGEIGRDVSVILEQIYKTE